MNFTPPKLDRYEMRCLKCKFLWIDYPGQWATQSKEGCPRCGSLYWKQGDKQ